MNPSIMGFLLEGVQLEEERSGKYIYCPDSSSWFCLGNILDVVTGDLNPKRKQNFREVE